MGETMDSIDTFWSFVKRRLIDTILIVGAILTFGLAVFGWLAAYPAYIAAEGPDAAGFQSAWSFAFGQALRAFVFSDVYASYTSTEYFSPLLEGVGIAGSVIAFGAIVRAAVAIFVRPIERFRASLRSGHVVVLGERDIAISAAEKIEEGGSVTYHGENPHLDSTHVLTVPRPMSLNDRFLKSSIQRSSRVIVAESTDIQTLETVLSISDYIEDETVFAVFEDPWISMEGKHLGSVRSRETDRTEKSGTKKNDGYIASRSTIRATARSAVLAVPPFLLATFSKQKRIHAVFVGFNALTMTLIEEILIANVISGQKLPRFTILAEHAFKAEQRFFARHEGLIEETRRSEYSPIDIEFIENVYDGLTDLAAARLSALKDNDPLTAVYVTIDQDKGPLGAAVAIQSAAIRRNLFTCPIFVHSPHGCGIPTAKWHDDFGQRAIYAFGGLDELISALGLLEETPDKLAREHHESYRRKVFGDESEEGAWENQTEMMRRANQNAILHLPAKLAAMGFDIRPYLLQDDALSPSTAPCLKTNEKLVLSPEYRETLAEMEHERWMMERWVAGWRYDAVRSNPHLKHPNLVAYHQLSEEKKDFDRDFVDWVGDWLERCDEKGISRAQFSSASG